MAKKVSAATPAPIKEKKNPYKLGPHATLFVDYATGLKIANSEVVHVLPHQANTEKFRNAVRNEHLTKADQDELSDYENKSTPSDDELEKRKALVEFNALASKEEKAAYIKDTYDLSPEEETEVDGMDDDQLLVAFKEWEGID